MYHHLMYILFIYPGFGRDDELRFRLRPIDVLFTAIQLGRDR